MCVYVDVGCHENQITKMTDSAYKVISNINISISVDAKEKEKFLSFGLFQNIKAAKVRYNDNGVLYSKNNKNWFLVNIKLQSCSYESVFEQIILELEKHVEELKLLGCDIEEDINIDFFFLHNGQMSWYFKTSHLERISKIFLPWFSIDCYLINDKETKDEDYNEELKSIDFYQAIFVLDKKDQENIVKSLFNEIYSKYSVHAIWKDSFMDNLLILEIKDFLLGEQFDEIYTSILNLLSIKSKEILDIGVNSFFGQYHTISSGSEVSFIMSELIKSKVDLIFISDFKDYRETGFPNDSLKILKHNKLISNVIEKIK